MYMYTIIWLQLQIFWIGTIIIRGDLNNSNWMNEWQQLQIGHKWTRQKVRGQAPYVDPAPEKVGVNWPPGPRGSAASAIGHWGRTYLLQVYVNVKKMHAHV